MIKHYIIFNKYITLVLIVFENDVPFYFNLRAHNSHTVKEQLHAGFQVAKTAFMPIKQLFKLKKRLKNLHVNALYILNH
jgi:hypothetical protein